MSVSTGGSSSWYRTPMAVSTWWWVTGKEGFAVSTEGTKCGKGWYL